jgi:hypothetical protein
MGTVIEAVPVAGVTANFSPMPLIAPPPLGRLIAWGASELEAAWGSRSADVLREQIVDEGLVAKPTPLGLAPHRVENLGIDPNCNQSPGSRPQGGPPHAPHRPELRGGRLRDV